MEKYYTSPAHWPRRPVAPLVSVWGVWGLGTLGGAVFRRAACVRHSRLSVSFIHVESRERTEKDVFFRRRAALACQRKRMHARHWQYISNINCRHVDSRAPSTHEAPIPRREDQRSLRHRSPAPCPRARKPSAPMPKVHHHTTERETALSVAITVNTRAPLDRLHGTTRHTHAYEIG